MLTYAIYNYTRGVKMEKKSIKTLVYLFVGMVGFGLGLIAVSLFLDFMNIKFILPMPELTGIVGGRIDLFSSTWDMYNVSPAFVIISYLVLIVGIIIISVDASFRQKLKKKVKGLNYIGLALAAVGFILLIVSIIVVKGQMEDAHGKFWLIAMKESGQADGMSDEMLKLSLSMLFSYDLGIGSIMAIIGGVIALIGGIMLVIPVFDPMKLAVEPAAPAAPAATTAAPAQPEAPVAEPAQPEAAATADTTENNTDAQ